MKYESGIRNQGLNPSLSDGHPYHSVTRLNLHQSGGFTLLELLVSVSIFILITTAVVANYRSGEQSAQLRLGAQNLASTLRLLQTMAQTGKTVELCNSDHPEYPNYVCTPGSEIDCDPCTARVPLGGYGLDIAQDGAITLFADSNNNKVKNDGETLIDVMIDLPQNISVGVAESGAMSVGFAPPNGAAWANTDVSLYIQHMKTNEERTIIVRPASGRIDVE